MKRMVKKLLLLGMAVALTAALAGCDVLNLGDNMIQDGKTYVQGTLDKFYLGKFNQEYMDLIDLTEEEAREEYESRLANEVEYFFYYWSIEEYSDELAAEVTEMYKEIYSHVKYTVGNTSKLDSGDYAVEVSVEPLNIMDLVTIDDMDAALEESGGDMAIYGPKIVEMVKAQIPNMETEPAVEMIFRLTEDTDGYYVLVEEDLQDFDLYIINY